MTLSFSLLGTHHASPAFHRPDEVKVSNCGIPSRMARVFAAALHDVHSRKISEMLSQTAHEHISRHRFHISAPWLGQSATVANIQSLVFKNTATSLLRRRWIWWLFRSQQPPAAVKVHQNCQTYHGSTERVIWCAVAIHKDSIPSTIAAKCRMPVEIQRANNGLAAGTDCSKKPGALRLNEIRSLSADLAFSQHASETHSLRWNTLLSSSIILKFHLSLPARFNENVIIAHIIYSYVSYACRHLWATVSFEVYLLDMSIVLYIITGARAFPLLPEQLQTVKLFYRIADHLRHTTLPLHVDHSQIDECCLEHFEWRS